MSLVYFEWQDDASENASKLDKTITNNKPIHYSYWDFTKNEIIEKEQKIGIRAWCDYFHAENTWPLFQEIQCLILSAIGKCELENNVDLSHVKRQFMIDVDECDKFGYSADKTLRQLELWYPIDNRLIGIPKKKCVDYYALVDGMRKSDFTNGFITPRNYISLNVRNSELQDAKDICIKLYNRLIEKKVDNIAYKALLLAGYSGMKRRLLDNFDDVQKMLDEKREDKFFDEAFLEQLLCCIDSMMILLGKTRDESAFNEQYMECMIAMYYFGTCDDSWRIRNHEIRY